MASKNSFIHFIIKVIFNFLAFGEVIMLVLDLRVLQV